MAVLVIILLWGADEPGADIDGDGIVAFGDVLEVLASWGPC